jgi:hypothetical protein
VDQAGNVYTCFCDQANIYYCASVDHGEHWTRPVRVNDGPLAKGCTMPTMAAGSAGRLVFSWYSTSTAGGVDNSDSRWTVMASRTEAALDSVPAFEQVLVSDHYVHNGLVCLDGTGCDGDRELLDLFEMDVNPVDGSSFITYTDDGAEGGTYISKQLAGTSAIAGRTIVDKSLSCPTNVPCVSCPPPPPPDPCQLPGVTVVRDASGDQTGAPANAQADIDSVMIAEPFFADGSRKLVATLKVENLDPTNLPPNTGWEVLFTAPNATQYFVEMDTFDPTTGVQFHYGHVDPTLGESTDGAIEGRLDQLGFITMTVDASLVGGAVRGQNLTGVHGQTEVLVGAQPGGVGGGELVFLDTTGNGVYTLVGNASCGLFGLISPPDQTVTAGDVKTLFFQISNSSGVAAQYDYMLADSLGWTTGHSAPLAGTTPSIPSGQSFTLQVEATVPTDCVNGRDTYRWSASPVGNAAAAETSLTHLRCGVPETACRLPGITVVSDGAGDQAASPQLTQFDVQHTSMAEPYFTDGTRALIVTMKVADLTAPLTPNGVWRTFWTVPHAGGSGNDSTYYVAMSTDQTGTPSYAFGVFVTNATTGTITQTRKGTAVGSESPDGTIQIASPLAYAGDPPVGTEISKVTTESRLLVGTSVTGGLIEQVDIGGWHGSLHDRGQQLLLAGARRPQGTFGGLWQPAAQLLSHEHRAERRELRLPAHRLAGLDLHVERAALGADRLAGGGRHVHAQRRCDRSARPGQAECLSLDRLDHGPALDVARDAGGVPRHLPGHGRRDRSGGRATRPGARAPHAESVHAFGADRLRTPVRRSRQAGGLCGDRAARPDAGRRNAGGGTEQRHTGSSWPSDRHLLCPARDGGKEAGAGRVADEVVRRPLGRSLDRWPRWFAPGPARSWRRALPEATAPFPPSPPLPPSRPSPA